MARFNDIDYQNIIGYWATKILGPVDIMDLYKAYEQEFGKVEWESILNENNAIGIGMSNEYIVSPSEHEMINNLNKLMAKFLWRDIRYLDRPKSPKEDKNNG